MTLLAKNLDPPSIRREGVTNPRLSIEPFDGAHWKVGLENSPYGTTMAFIQLEELNMASKTNALAESDPGKPNLVAVTDASFDADVLASSRPVLVKFEADWCAPCQAIKPMVEELAAEYGDRLTVATLDVDPNNRTPYRFGVRGVPTLMLFKNGEVVAQRVGAARKADLEAMLSSKL